MMDIWRMLLSSDKQPERQDVATVGLSPTADRLLKEIVEESEWFDRELDVYRCAVAIALGKGLEPMPVGEGRATKFNVGTLETKDQKIAGLISSFSPEHRDDPYSFSQELAEAGIRYIHQALVENLVTVHEALL